MALWFRKSRRMPSPLHKRRVTLRPVLDLLEDRLAPATLVVNTADDNLTADAELTLREAVNAIVLQSSASFTPNEQAQINETNPFGVNDTILFAPGLTSNSIVLSGDITLQNDMTIDGRDAPGLFISGNDATRIFVVSDGVDGASIQVNIQNIALTQGYANGDGGAIVNYERLNLQSIELTHSFGGQGGGVFDLGVLNIHSSTFTGNHASVDGGAIFHGGLGRLTIVNSTLSDNRADQFGSAITTNNSSFTTIVNSTIVANWANADDTGFGDGALDNFNANTFELFNTIVAGNVKGNGTIPSEINGTVTGRYNLIGDAATSGGLVNGTDGNLVGNAGSGTLDIATLLDTTLAINGGTTRNHALIAGSLALNAGDSSRATIDGQVGSAALTSDQRRAPFARSNGTVDIGAYEAQTLNLVVDNNADDVDDGNYLPGNLTLREAVNLANANPGADAITFSNALANQTITLGGTELLITDSVTITGLGANLLTISGNNASRIFQIDDGTVGIDIDVTISHMTITQGFEDGSRGGAVRNLDRLNLGFVEITHSRSEDTGGGGFTIGGGGVFNAGDMTISNSTLASNSTISDGGAIRNEDSTLVGVTATLLVVNSTLSSNSADGFGSAITSFDDSTVTLVNSTIVNNRTDADNDNDGAGALDQSGTATFELYNTIVAGNTRGNGLTPSDLSGAISGNSNLIGDANSAGGLSHGDDGNIVGNAGTGTLDINAILNTTLANNGGPTRTHALVAGSLAIDSGDNARATENGQIGGTALVNDQRGSNRFVNNVDRGSFEAPDTTAPTVTSVNSPTANGLHRVGAIIDVVVNFSEPVFVTGTPQLTLETGFANAVVDFTSGNGTTALTFRYTVGIGHENIDLDVVSAAALALNGGTIRDAAGNNAALTLPTPGAAGSLSANKALIVDGVTRILVVASEPGVPSAVRVFDGDGQTVRSTMQPFAGFTGGVRAAAGDVNRDGVEDIIVGAGPGAPGGHVKVFDGAIGAEIRSFFSFPGFLGGVSVAGGDLDGDGFGDILVGAGPGAPGGHVKAFSGATGAEIRSFFAFPGFVGGVNVASGDIDGDRRDDFVAAAGPGGNGHVKVFRGTDNAEIRSFLAFPGFGGGVHVTAGDVDGDGFGEIITSGAGVQVWFNGTNNAQRATLAAFPGFGGEVKVDAIDRDRDGLADLVAMASVPGVHVKSFNGLTQAAIDSFFAFPEELQGGSILR